ncbi:alpha/beta hydrolase family protein [Actinomycetospora sp. CA-053990]|uniref:alpha/beta hydrolase family protein n=1 Tax=Actinomycetospora sp. CA-053990 TaxID=3239891 RepID=UPI003D93FED7
MPLLSSNPLWEEFGERALLFAPVGGGDFGECQVTVDRVGDDGTAEDWHREWRATAERVRRIGEDCAAKGHRRSAHEAFLRASTYHRVSYFPLYGAPTDPRLAEAFDDETSAFTAAAPLAPWPIEPLEIVTDAGTFPGWFARPDDSDTPRPTVLQTNGLDSTIHEMFLSHGPAALSRGYNWIGFDGPGQGRVLIRDGLPMRPDWETVVTPVVDHVQTLSGVDPDRIALVGWSFGGFLAPRAAGVEHRIAALVADPGQWDMREAIVARLPLTDAQKAAFPDIDPHALDPMETWLREQADASTRWRMLQRGPWVAGTATFFDYLVDQLRYEVSSVAGDIACPTLLTQGLDDRIADGAPRLRDALRVPVELVPFTADEGAGDHCEMRARSLYHQRVFDWLDETLGHRS